MQVQCSHRPQVYRSFVTMATESHDPCRHTGYAPRDDHELARKRSRRRLRDGVLNPKAVAVRRVTALVACVASASRAAAFLMPAADLAASRGSGCHADLAGVLSPVWNRRHGHCAKGGSFRHLRSVALESYCRPSRSILMVASPSEHGTRRREMGGEVDAVSRQPSVEIVRMDMPEVPVERAQVFLRNWSKRRSRAEDQSWSGPVRPAGPQYGVPKTSMPVSPARSPLGVVLSFDGTPTDVISIEALHLRGGGTCVMVSRGVDGLAKLGGMGPQIASLVRHSENEIKDKLETDLTEFAQEYHERVLRGLAPAASRDEDGTDDGVEENEATVLPDGTIDVTPKGRRAAKVPAPWEDGSAPPPVSRLEDAIKEAEIPMRAVGSNNEREPEVPEVPEVQALFDEVDTDKFNKEAFDLFETMQRARKGQEEVVGAVAADADGFQTFFSNMRSENTSKTELLSMFEAGKNASRKGGSDQASIPVESDLAQLEVIIGGDTGLRGGIDIFAGPPRPIGGRVGTQTGSDVGGNTEDSTETAGEGDTRGTYTMFDEQGDPVLELTAQEMDSLDEEKLTEAMASVDVLLGELLRCPKDLWDGIASEYTDLYLSPYYIISMRARIPKADKEEREAMHAANQWAVNTVQQLADVHKRLEMQQLEKIRDICEAALEDMDSLPDKIRYMKPLLDDNFVAYLGYAIQKEKEDIVKAGMDPDREPTRWLQVLGVIQRGVMAELSKAVYDDVEAVSHVLRLREPEERFTLLNYTISTLPSMHVRGFKRTATNIVDYYRAQGDACHDKDLQSMVLEMGQALDVLMSDERVAFLCGEVDEWAAKKAEEDSLESKARRLREYEAEELELKRKTASGLWNRKMHPDARMDTEEKAEIKKLTDALRQQNLLETGAGSRAQLTGSALQAEFVDDGNDPGEYDDGTFADDADLRRKLRRLTDPGGLMESDSRGAAQMFAPGGVLKSAISTGEAPMLPSRTAELERKAAEGVVDLSEAFTNASEYDADVLNDRDKGQGDHEWGTFDDSDWSPKKERRASNDTPPRPRGAAAGEDVPGLLGGVAFEREGEGEEKEVLRTDDVPERAPPR